MRAFTMPRRRPHYADVAATLALLLAGGGTAYAATALPRGSVGTTQLHKHAVTSPKLATEAVTHAKLSPNAVTGGDVANGTLHLADMVGIDESGDLNFTLAANACGLLDIGVSGARVGQVAILTLRSANPVNVVLGPLRVKSSTLITSTACNITNKTLRVNSLRVRVVTLS